MSEDVIAWIDVETTGLDPAADLLLEVACLVTDTRLNLLDEHGYHAVIDWPAPLLAAAREHADPVVREMHDATGLWDRAADPTNATPVTVVDAELLTYLRRFAPHSRTARLGGNSVRLDLNFAEEYLPATAAHLHYRVIDVSTVAALATWWCGVPPMPKERRHEAFADIRESLTELRRLLVVAFR